MVTVSPLRKVTSLIILAWLKLKKINRHFAVSNMNSLPNLPNIQEINICFPTLVYKLHLLFYREGKSVGKSTPSAFEKGNLSWHSVGGSLLSCNSICNGCRHIALGGNMSNQLFIKGIARTQSPTNKNYALELPTFGVIVGVSPTGVQWRGLALEEPPS